MLAQDERLITTPSTLQEDDFQIGNYTAIELSLSWFDPYLTPKTDPISAHNNLPKTRMQKVKKKKKARVKSTAAQV